DLRLRRRPSRRLRGRADLPRAAGRPVELLRPPASRGRPGAPLAPAATRHGTRCEDHRGAQGQLRGVRRAEGVAPAPAGRRARGALHGRAADARGGAAGRRARGQGAHDAPDGGPRRGGAGPRAAAVQRRAPEPALGGRFHVRGDLARLRVRRLRGRRVLSAHRRLARSHRDAHGPRARRAGPGALRPRARWPARSSLRPRLAIRRHALHGATSRGRRGALGRQCGRRVRQRARRERDRLVQGGADPPAGALARLRRRRVRDVGVGRVVQPAAPARAARLRPAGGVRGAVPPCPARSHGGCGTHV
ncbi:MAG: Mobile element protein, partial [uncultured Gemmatimonadaceae bacterium]